MPAGRRKARALVYTSTMAQGGGGTAWIWILVGLGVLVSVCCIGTGVAGYFGFRAQEARQAEAVEELMRYDEASRRQEEEAMRQAENERLLAEGMQGDFEPPTSLGLSPGPSSDRAPRHIVAVITRAAGSVASVGDRCEFDVQVLDSDQPPGYWCRALVECRGTRIYGTDTPSPNGFFPCEVYGAPLGVAGEDLQTSTFGGDGAFQIDTRVGRLTVVDDAASMVGAPFRIEAAISEVR